MNSIFGVIDDLYGGSGTDFVKCHECNYKSERSTKLYDLILPVRNEFENVRVPLTCTPYVNPFFLT